MKCPKCGAMMYKNFSVCNSEIWACSECDYEESKNYSFPPDPKNSSFNGSVNKSASDFHQYSNRTKKQLPITFDDIIDFHDKLKNLRI